MPGAPNRPPDITPTTPPAPTTAETPEQHVARRLAPFRVALRLPIWKGAPSPELLQPYTEAERLFATGDAKGADGCLDRLSVRFAEPRWPTIPEPFRSLRVPIPAPHPPEWDAENRLAPPEKEALRFQRYAAAQLALLRASLTTEAARGTPTEDLNPLVDSAGAAHAAGDIGPAFWEPVDRVWQTLRERLPVPTGAPVAPLPAAAGGIADGA